MLVTGKMLRLIGNPYGSYQRKILEVIGDHISHPTTALVSEKSWRIRAAADYTMFFELEKDHSSVSESQILTLNGEWKSDTFHGHHSQTKDRIVVRQIRVVFLLEGDQFMRAIF